MAYNQSINRCQPGHGSSCSLCCGSHNYTFSIEEIENIFEKRGQNSDNIFLKHPEISDFIKIFPNELQCSHVGIIPSEHGNPGCLLYDDYNLESKLGIFYKGTCKRFHCPAWDELTDEQVIYAARLMKDWYYYSLFINDIEAVQELHATYSNPEDVPDDELDIIKEEIKERFIEEDGK